jgi:hypothetical protein
MVFLHLLDLSLHGVGHFFLKENERNEEIARLVPVSKHHAELDPNRG